jgi:hypothetical protein
LIQRQEEARIDKEKFSFAKAKWLQKRGVNVLAIDRHSEEESRKLFRFIDYNNDGVIHRNQLKLFIAFLEGEKQGMNLIRPLK